MKNYDVNNYDRVIQQLKRLALELNEISDAVPAVKRNTARILASIKMLELNISDIARLEDSQQ